MSIAALIRAAEYIERRDRGELSFLCSSRLARTRRHGSRLFSPSANQLILTESQFCLLQRRSTGTRRVCRRATRRAAAGTRRRSRKAAGECGAPWTAPAARRPPAGTAESEWQ
ncbi:hypothetical protein RR46_03998 [Papilio xuthus]|uniref:Uncharacterized protein n=1 Tax=Papilio xuthus TaxID=66420 RepID=A0A194QNV3_PAPXU|nr:hypothetical protein RR46_03998 [Papilio xuthus]